VNNFRQQQTRPDLTNTSALETVISSLFLIPLVKFNHFGKVVQHTKEEK
jgi:hypothetical protein